MTFKFHVNQNPLSIEFETGSIEEGLAILSEKQATLAQFFATAAALANAQPLNPTTVEVGPESADAPTTGSAKRSPGRPRKDAAPPSAPPPAPIPGAQSAPVAPPAAPSAPLPPPMSVAPPTAPNGNYPTPPAGDSHAIPDFLKATPPAPPAAPAAPPPPPTPPTPPTQQGSALGLATVAELKKRADTSADKGAALLGWLQQCKIVIPGATFPEALAIVEWADAGQLKPVADALGVTAA